MPLVNEQLDGLWAEIETIRAYALNHLQPTSGKSDPRLNEPQTSRVMVEPILSRLGWGNSDDRDSLWREFELSSGRVDLACRLEGRTRVTVECKKFGTDLRAIKHATQACLYAYESVSPYAVLTDGAVWSIYDTFMEADTKEKLLVSINIRKCKKEEAWAFFRPLTIENARAGDIKVRRLPKAVASKAKRKGKRRFRRAHISSPEFKPHIEAVTKELGDLVLMDSSRNTFVNPHDAKKPVVRFCVAEGTKSDPIFSLPGGMLIGCERIYLARKGESHGWLVPTADIQKFFKQDVDLDQVVARSHTIRLAKSADGDPVMMFPLLERAFGLEKNYLLPV
jgi:hypothetical protein